MYNQSFRYHRKRKKEMKSYNRMEHRYNSPMTSLKNWFKEEQAAVGHLSGMKDEFLQRRYASKVAAGMNHLADALQEKMDEVVDEDKKRELRIMKNTIGRSLEHVEKDYDVKRTNLSYAWNTSGLVSVPAASLAPVSTMSMPRTNTTMSMSLPSTTASLAPTGSLFAPSNPRSLNESTLTLENVKNYGSLEEEEGSTPTMSGTPAKGGRRNYRKTPKARKTRKGRKAGRR
jgi:hypothetical protein